MRKLLRLINVLENSLLYGLVAVLVGLAVYQIVLRNVFRSGLYWGDPMLRVVVLWLAMVGAMVATREGGHISIDVLSHYSSDRARVVTAILVKTFSAVVCFIAAYYGFIFVADERVYGMTAFADVPVWWCEAIIPLGFSSIGVRFIGQSLTMAFLEERPS